MGQTVVTRRLESNYLSFIVINICCLQTVDMCPALIAIETMPVLVILSLFEKRALIDWILSVKAPYRRIIHQKIK
jgi:hypothetical protein